MFQKAVERSFGWRFVTVLKFTRIMNYEVKSAARKTMALNINGEFISDWEKQDTRSMIMSRIKPYLFVNSLSFFIRFYCTRCPKHSRPHALLLISFFWYEDHNETTTVLVLSSLVNWKMKRGPKCVCCCFASLFHRKIARASLHSQSMRAADSISSTTLDGPDEFWIACKAKIYFRQKQR